MKPQTNRLLIVDDNEMNRDMLARRLARKGYDVLVANGAHDLVESVKQDGVGRGQPAVRGCAGPVRAGIGGGSQRSVSAGGLERLFA